MKLFKFPLFRYLLCSACLTLPSCLVQKPKKTDRRKLFIPAQHIDAYQISTPITNEPPPMTIWVHGTRVLPRFILRNFQYSKPGLHPALSMDFKYHLRSIAESLSQTAPHMFPLETFYLFGWSGKLNFKMRETAARQLYKELKIAIAHYKQKYNQRPKIQFITHSHGGNVVLNLAKVKDPNDMDLIVERLILMACPVQMKTKKFMRHAMFKKTYALYSSLDMVQIIAPQIFYKVQIEEHNGGKKEKIKIPLFSSRQFPPQEKLAQVCIKMNGRAILHTEFVRDRFLRILPTLLDHIDGWQQEELQYNNQEILQNRLLSIYTPRKKRI